MQEQTYTNGTEVSNNDSPKLHTTKSGYTIHFRSIAPNLIAKVQQAVEDPPKPTYKEEQVRGKNEDGSPLMVEIDVEHDETTLETDEDRQAWADYLAKQEEADRVRKERIMQLFYLRGIDVDLPESDEWMEDQKWLGIDVPTDDVRKLKLHFLDTEVLASPEDIMEVITAIMGLSGVEQEAIDEAKAMFRRTLSGQGTDNVDAESESEQPDAEGMDLQHSVQGRGHSVQMETDSFEFLESPTGRASVDDSVLQHSQRHRVRPS